MYTDVWTQLLYNQTSLENIWGYFTIDIWFLISPWRKFVFFATPKAHVLLMYGCGFLYMSSSFTFHFILNVINNTSEVNKVKKGYQKGKLTGIKDLINEIYGFNNGIADYFLPTNTKVPLIIPEKA
jgi:hypothetical protein